MEMEQFHNWEGQYQGRGARIAHAIVRKNINSHE